MTIYDTGVDGTTAFIVMELLAGPTLIERVTRADRLALPEVLKVGEQVCLALSAAHAAGVVHRDIKPSNVAYAGNDTVKVLDFGVARMIEATTGQTDLTLTATVIGTASYLSPEQARGDPVSPSTDLYALGCLLFALVTGGPPFRGESALVVCSQHLYKEPPHLSVVVDGVPPGLSALVDDLLKKNPADRPADAELVRRRLVSVVPNTPGDDLTAPIPLTQEAASLSITEELVATREYPSDASSSAPRAQLSQPAVTAVDPRHGLASAVSKPPGRRLHRGRWGIVISLVVALVITLVVVASDNTPSKLPSLPAITIPAPVSGASPLPAPLVKALNNLARSVAS